MNKILNKTVKLKRAGYPEQRWADVTKAELNAIFDRAKSYDDLEYIHVETPINAVGFSYEN